MSTQRWKLGFIALIYTLMLLGCTKIQIQKTDTNPLLRSKNTPIAVVPFYNYTQTPMAGYSAAAISYGLLQQHGYQTIGIDLQPISSPLPQVQHISYDTYKQKLKRQGLRYLLNGEVTEWRYKAGIDAQPVVGFVITIIDLQNDKTIYSATGSQSGSVHTALSQTAQTLLDKLLP